MDEENDKFKRKSSRDQTDQKYNENSKEKKLDDVESSDSDNDEELPTPKLAPNPFFKIHGSSASVNDM